MRSNIWHPWIFGDVSFPQSEEYEEFRYKLLMVLMLSGALFTALFIVGERSGINPIQTAHMVSMHLFTAAALACWIVLWGRKHLFQPIAWTYETVCMLEYTSALWLVPGDELRLLWFFINVPGVFILLGPTAGWCIAVLTVVILWASNAALPVPYSTNAMATATLALIYLGLFFHAYGARSMSYFIRMRDSMQELERLASHDMLTGVLNGRAYYVACEQNIRLAVRNRQPYAVLFVDLDHFKSINDTYGHAAGDAVLRAVAACLAAVIRTSDLLGRIGGEEFSLFLPNVSRADAMRLAESLRQSVEARNPDIGDGRTLRVTASIGVSVCEEPGESIQTIQKKADQAMYVAKSMGRNRVSAFDELPPANSEIETKAA